MLAVVRKSRLLTECNGWQRFSCYVVLLIVAGKPRDSQGQYLIKCVGDQRYQCVAILICYWEALASSAIWRIIILAHRRL